MGGNIVNTKESTSEMRVTEGQQIKECKVEYKPGNRIQDLQFLKNTARSFHDAAHRCRIENVSIDGTSVMLGIPMVVNLAFRLSFTLSI